MKKGKSVARTRGVTLLEAMVALAVLAVALAGTISGLIHSSKNLKDGQMSQFKNVLLEAKTQRLLVADKKLLFVIPPTSPLIPAPINATTDPSKQYPVGTTGSPWQPDPTASVAGDLGTGAYFTIRTDGEISAVAVAGNPACGSSQIPTGVYCRELLTTNGLPPEQGASNPYTVPSGATAYTVWVRVSRSGDPASLASVQREVLIQ